jgi:hypothetical protein
MLVMDLDRATELVCRTPLSQRVLYSLAMAVPIATVNALLTRSPDRLEVWLFAFAIWFFGNLIVASRRLFGTFAVNRVGIRMYRRTIHWYEVQDIEVVHGPGNARRCRLRYFHVDIHGKAWNGRTNLLFTAWWFPDPDFDARVNLLVQCRQRYLDSLPPHPEGRPGEAPPQITSK